MGAANPVWLGGNDITATSDGTLPTALNQILDPNLADNGGGMLTHRLVSGSPAVDGASESCPILHDQRGFVRLPGVAVCDIGPVEMNFPNRQVAMASGSATISYDVGVGNRLYKGECSVWGVCECGRVW